MLDFTALAFSDYQSSSAPHGIRKNNMAEILIVDGCYTEGIDCCQNLAAIIDVKCVRKLQSGARSNQRIQVEHRTTSSQTNACKDCDNPTSLRRFWPFELIARPRLQASPSTVPRSKIRPVSSARHRDVRRWQIRGTGNVPRIVDPNRFQSYRPQRPQIFHPAFAPYERMGHEITGRLACPITSPRLLVHCPKAKVPPKFPRSVIFPLSQTKGSCVGMPVLSLGAKSV